MAFRPISTKAPQVGHYLSLKLESYRIEYVVFVMEFFLVVALIGLVTSTLAGIAYLVKRTVAPPQTPYDVWLDEAKKQSVVKLNPRAARTASRMMH